MDHGLSWIVMDYHTVECKPDEHQCQFVDLQTRHGCLSDLHSTVDYHGLSWYVCTTYVRTYVWMDLGTC